MQLRTWIRTTCLCLCLLPAASAPGKEPTDGTIQQARSHFQAGNGFYAARSYDRAVEEYLAAHRLWPAPAFLFNIAQSYRLKGDLPQALGHYERFLALQPAGRGSDEARRHVAALRAADVSSAPVNDDAETPPGSAAPSPPAGGTQTEEKPPADPAPANPAPANPAPANPAPINPAPINPPPANPPPANPSSQGPPISPPSPAAPRAAAPPPVIWMLPMGSGFAGQEVPLPEVVDPWMPPPPPSASPAPSPPATSRQPLYRRWWLWTAVAGGVVLIGGVGLGVGLSQAPETPSATTTDGIFRPFDR